MRVYLACDRCGREEPLDPDIGEAWVMRNVVPVEAEGWAAHYPEMLLPLGMASPMETTVCPDCLTSREEESLALLERDEETPAE